MDRQWSVDVAYKVNQVTLVTLHYSFFPFFLSLFSFVQHHFSGTWPLSKFVKSTCTSEIISLAVTVYWLKGMEQLNDSWRPSKFSAVRPTLKVHTEWLRKLRNNTNENTILTSKLSGESNVILYSNLSGCRYPCSFVIIYGWLEAWVHRRRSLHKEQETVDLKLRPTQDLDRLGAVTGQATLNRRLPPKWSARLGFLIMTFSGWQFLNPPDLCAPKITPFREPLGCYPDWSK